LSQSIDWNDFEKVDIRVGTIIEAEPFPEARKPAYKLKIDFGPLGIKRSSAQITDRYDIKALAGRKIAAVVNFAPKQIGPVLSDVLVLGAITDSGVALLNVDHWAENGTRIV